MYTVVFPCSLSVFCHWSTWFKPIVYIICLNDTWFVSVHVSVSQDDKRPDITLPLDLCRKDGRFTGDNDYSTPGTLHTLKTPLKGFSSTPPPDCQNPRVDTDTPGGGGFSLVWQGDRGGVTHKHFVKCAESEPGVVGRRFDPTSSNSSIESLRKWIGILKRWVRQRYQ